MGWLTIVTHNISEAKSKVETLRFLKLIKKKSYEVITFFQMYNNFEIFKITFVFYFK